MNAMTQVTPTNQVTQGGAGLRGVQDGRRVVIAAGGTGGHFFPAESLAAELQARGIAVALMTDARSAGADSAAFAGQPVHVLSGAGLAGRGAVRAARGGFALGAGTLQARALLRRLHPSVIVGFGGYPTVAPVLGSMLLRRRVPVVLHEQNAVLGRTNRALCRRGVLALSFDDTQGVPARARRVVVGNPVRPAIAAMRGAPYVAPAGDGPIRILVLGGSLGARVMSEVVPTLLAALPPALRARLVVTQQCRLEDLAGVRARYDACGIPAVLDSFFADMAGLYAACQLVIARAGASTVAELGVVGRPAILVPLPSAIDDHQSANARAAVQAGAWLVPQPDFEGEAAAALLRRLLEQPALLAQAAWGMAQGGRDDAAARLADVVEQAVAAS